MWGLCGQPARHSWHAKHGAVSAGILKHPCFSGHMISKINIGFVHRTIKMHAFSCNKFFTLLHNEVHCPVVTTLEHLGNTVLVLAVPAGTHVELIYCTIVYHKHSL